MMLVMMSTILSAQQLAFPGAQGWGRFAKGARASSSPTVYHVTNLNDSGTGSFRDAVSSPNRVIVFDVAGTIKIKSGLVFSKNLTVLGQTAPGDGVQIYGDRVSFSGADNLIVRHMRFRMGKSAASGQKDACGIANGGNMIFDHLSVLWGRDECFSISWDNKGTAPHDITIQNSIIGQGLQSHSCGGLIQTEGGVTLFRNLYIENKTRNPKVKHLNQFINNVVYNWGNGGCYLMGRESAGNSWAEIVNNYFVKGPWDTGYKPLQEGNSNFQFYGEGNYYDDNRDGQLNGHLYTDDEYTASGALRRATLTEITNAPKEFPVITELMTAEQALKWMIDSVGPSLPARDEVDQYLIDELTSYGTGGSNGGISDETTLPHKGTGFVSPGNKPKDTDNDGIPDEWETANGLNPNNASDAVAIAANGYLNIENYVFTITEAYPYLRVPTNLAVTNQETQSISVSWTDNAKDEQGYIIEYSTDNKNFSEAGRVGANTTSFTATGLQKEKTYYFRVKAYGADGLESVYSNVLTTETKGDPAPPKQCTNPSPAEGESVGTASGALTLTWENATKNYYGTVMYLVYFGTDANNLERITTTQAKTVTYTKELEAGKTYYWRVNARNDQGVTEGVVWSFKTVKGGVLFETDFNTKPEAFAQKYPGTANVNIINGNTSTTVAGMTFGATGSSSARIVSFSDSGLTGDYSADDAGATARCVEFTSGSGYITFPEVEGPCTITIWTGNSDSNSKEFKLNTIVGGTEKTATTFTLKNAKKNFKHTYTYTATGKVQFKIDNNGKKFRVHDVLIEKYVSDDPAPTPDDPDPTPDDPDPQDDGVTKKVCIAWGNCIRTGGDDDCTELVGNEEAPSNNKGFSMHYTTATGKTYAKGEKMTYEFDGVQRTGIKLSNGAQNTIILPADYKVTKVTFWSVTANNASNRTSYWKEVAGKTYTEADGQLLSHTATAAAPNKAEFVLDDVQNELTFTNSGEQQSIVIVLEYHTGDAPTPDPDPTPEPVSAELSFSATSASVVLGEPFTAPTLTNPHNVTVTWASSNTAVATVSQQGVVTPVGAGVTTISASFAGNADYLQGSASYQLTVTEPVPDGINGLQADGGRVEYFTPSGERVTKPGKGLYIMRVTTGSGTSTHKVRR